MGSALIAAKWNDIHGQEIVKVTQQPELEDEVVREKGQIPAQEQYVLCCCREEDLLELLTRRIATSANLC